MECKVFGYNSAVEFHKVRRGMWQNLLQKNGDRGDDKLM